MTQGINSFGFLTIGGKQIKFEEFDKDGNGEISAQEYQQTLQELGISEDTVEFSSVDKNKDKKISGEEFVIMEQRIEMESALTKFIQDTVNKEITDIGQRRDITYLLQNYLEDFIEAYGTKNLDKMSAKFVEALPAKYEEIKADVVGEPKGRGGDDVVEKHIKEIKQAADDVATDYGNRLSLDSDQHRQLFNTLVEKGKTFVILTNDFDPNTTINKASIQAWMRNWLSNSDKSLMQNNIDSWNKTLQDIGNYCSADDFKKLREEAEKFLKQLLLSGIELTVDEFGKVDSMERINELLGKFKASSAWSLMNLIKLISNKLSTKRFDDNNSANEGIIKIDNTYLHLNSIDKCADDVDWGDINNENVIEIINNAIDKLYKKYGDMAPEGTNSWWIGVMGRFLEKEAVKIMQDNPDYTQEQLVKDLEKFMDHVDRDEIEGDNGLISSWIKAIDTTNNTTGIGLHIDDEELAELKELAEQIIERIFEKLGEIIVDNDGNKIDIQALLDKINNYTTDNAQELIGLINTIINGVSDKPRYLNILAGKGINSQKIKLDLDNIDEGTTIKPSEPVGGNNEIIPEGHTAEEFDRLRKQLHDTLYAWAKDYVHLHGLSTTIVDTVFNFENMFNNAIESQYEFTNSNNGLATNDPDYEESYIYTYDEETLTETVNTKVKQEIVSKTANFLDNTQSNFNPQTANLKGSLNPVYGIANGVKGFDKATEKLKEGAQGLAWNLYKNAVAAGCDSARASRAMSSLKAFYVAAMNACEGGDNYWTQSHNEKVTGSFKFTDENGNEYSCNGSTIESSKKDKDVNQYEDLSGTSSPSGLYIGCKRDPYQPQNCVFYVNIKTDTAIEWFKKFLG